MPFSLFPKQQPDWSHVTPKSSPFSCPVQRLPSLLIPLGVKPKGPAPSSAVPCPRFCGSLQHPLSSRKTSLLAAPGARPTHSRSRGLGLLSRLQGSLPQGGGSCPPYAKQQALAPHPFSCYFLKNSLLYFSPHRHLLSYVFAC